MSTYFCSIDSSTNLTAIALFIDGIYNRHILINKKHIKNVEERIDAMGSAIMNVLDEMNPDIVYIESPRGHGSSQGLVEKLATIIGIVRGWCISHDVYVQTVLPSVWRKYAGINQGKKKRAELKAESIAYVKTRYNIDVTDDEADAIALGDAMVNRYKGETGL